MPKWIKDVKESAPENVLICLCGNKIDLEAKRLITDRQGKDFAEKFFADYHFTVSAKTDQGINDMMNSLAKSIQERFGESLKMKLAKRESGRISLHQAPEGLQKIKSQQLQADYLIQNEKKKDGCCLLF